ATLNGVPADFPFGRAFLGMRIDSANGVGEVAELTEDNNAGQRIGSDTASLFFVRDVAEAEPNDTQNQARDFADLNGEALNVRISGTITADTHDLYRVSVDEDGRMMVRVHGEGVDTRLRLLDSPASEPNNPDDRGNELVRSEAISGTDPDDLLVQ